MVVMVVKIKIGVCTMYMYKFCLNVDLEKENDIVTGLKKRVPFEFSRVYL